MYEKGVGGTIHQSIPSCLKVLDVFLKRQETILESLVVSSKTKSNADDVVEVIKKILGKNLRLDFFT